MAGQFFCQTRNFEQDWNAVSDVDEGCFLSPAKGMGFVI